MKRHYNFREIRMQEGNNIDQRINELEDGQRQAFDILEDCQNAVSMKSIKKKIAIAMALLTDDEQ